MPIGTTRSASRPLTLLAITLALALAAAGAAAQAQQGEQVVEDLYLAGMRRLDPEQQAADTLYLTKGTEYRIAELQFYP